MSLERSSKVVVIGIDGFVPSVAEAYATEGLMPALKAIRARGSSIRLVSTVPATTPVAWAAMATGCHPNINGIEGFLLHRPGRRIGDRISGITVDRLCAEPIWDTVALSGRKAFVVKFPISYPSTIPTLRVDGAAGWGGITCLHEITPACVSRLGKGLDLAPAWLGEPPKDLSEHLQYTCITLVTHWGGPSLTLHVAISWSRDKSSPRIIVSDKPSWSAASCQVNAGEMTDPIFMLAHGRRGEEDVALRLKLLVWPMRYVENSLVGYEFFTTGAHTIAGHSNPDDTFSRHSEAAGPIEEECDPELLFAGEIDMATQIERCRLSAEWLARISRSILTKETWDLFMVQVHFVDWAHHILQGPLDARHPLHDPTRQEEANLLLRRFYVMADDLIEVIANAAGSEANVLVMGDHGQDLHHTTFRANSWLRNQGLLFGEESGELIDWTRSKAMALGNSIYLNVRGRDPEGIVDPAEVSTLILRIIDGLTALVDPRTGEFPVRVAGPKDHFSSLGANGLGMGDCIFFLASGYQARNDSGPVFSLTEPWREFTSGHDHFWPLDSRIHTALYAAGPRIVPNTNTSPLASIIDVAPTIADLMGIDAPFHSQGQVLKTLLINECESKQI